MFKSNHPPRSYAQPNTFASNQEQHVPPQFKSSRGTTQWQVNQWTANWRLFTTVPFQSCALAGHWSNANLNVWILLASCTTGLFPLPTPLIPMVNFSSLCLPLFNLAKKEVCTRILFAYSIGLWSDVLWLYTVARCQAHLEDGRATEGTLLLLASRPWALLDSGSAFPAWLAAVQYLCHLRPSAENNGPPALRLLFGQTSLARLDLETAPAH